MEVTVVCFGAMREYLPDPSTNRATIALPDDATIADLLRHLSVPDRLLHMCLVDGERVDANEGLRDGAEVTLMPPFSGGDE